MKLRHYILVLLVILASCGRKPETNETQKKGTAEVLGQDTANAQGQDTAEPQSEGTALADNPESFLSLFKELDPSNLHVYPPDFDKGKLLTSPFNGQPIDVNKYDYLNNDKIFRNIESCKRGESNIYAVGKFDIDQNTLALLFRQHSQYWESVIELTFWDKKTNTITKGIDLADSFGDAGWYFDTESWINYGQDSTLEIVTRRKDHNYDDEDDDGLGATTVTDSLMRRIVNNRTFVLVSINKSDTSLYPLKRWN